MKTKILRLLCLVTVLVISTSQAQPCNDDSDCIAGYCCQILNPNPVVSKRGIYFTTSYPSSGTCERYLTQGETCGPLDEMNGYCSCGPGLKCTHHPPATRSALEKRTMPPGTFDCQPTE